MAKHRQEKKGKQPPPPSPQPPASLALTKHESENKMAAAPCDKTLGSHHIINATLADIRQLLATLSVHPDRIIYALAGLTFSPKSPPPIGGSKLKPGYAAFKGPDAATLLTWIVTESYKTYWITRDPAILSFLAKSFNRILAMHQRGEKDALDERLMKGLKKAGHISWYGPAYIPYQFRHVDEAEVAMTGIQDGVEFCLPVPFPWRRISDPHSSSRLDGIACPLLRRESSQELSGSVVSGYVSKRVLAIGTSSVSDTNCTVNPATNLPITLY